MYFRQFQDLWRYFNLIVGDIALVKVSEIKETYWERGKRTLCQ